MISGREATRRLFDRGLTTRSARLVLACGLAGEAVRTAGATLFDERAVDALVEAPLLGHERERALFPRGVLVSRRAFDILTTSPLEMLAEDWDFSVWTRARIHHVLDEQGHFPLVATVGGFIVGGADVVGVRPGGRRATGLDLDPPGSWAREVRGCRLPTGRGRDFSLRPPPPAEAG